MHDVVQIAMGWFDCHLWEFTIVHRTDGLPMNEDWGTEPRTKAINVRLRDMLKPQKTTIDYFYDMGDSWERQLTVTNIRQGDPDISYPRYVAGQWAAPPEDCGALPGFYDALAGLRQRNENFQPHTLARPADKPIVERLTRIIDRGRIAPETAGPQDVHDAADHPAVVHSGNIAGSFGSSGSRRKNCAHSAKTCCLPLPTQQLHQPKRVNYTGQRRFKRLWVRSVVCPRCLAEGVRDAGRPRWVTRRRSARQRPCEGTSLCRWWKRGFKAQAFGVSCGGRTTNINAAERRPRTPTKLPTNEWPSSGLPLGWSAISEACAVDPDDGRRAYDTNTIRQ